MNTTKLLAAGLLVSALVSSVAPNSTQAGPATGHTTVVPSRPRTDVVRVLDGEVSETALWGNRIVLAGTFTQVTDTDGTVFNRKYLVAYDQTTGKLDRGFDPVIDRPVFDIAGAVTGSGLFIVGEFNTVDGIARRKIAKLDGAGNVVAGFVANADQRVADVVATPSRVYVGGRFGSINGTTRLRLAALNLSTGAVDATFDLPLTEGAGLPVGTSFTQALDVTADYSTLMVSHTARKVAGQDRLGLALINIAAKPAVLKPWRTRTYEPDFARYGYIFPTNAAIAADGSFVVAVHSGGDAPPTRDTAVRWPTNLTGDDVQPAWVNRSFDSLYAVAITDQAVYIGGHLAFTEAPGSIDPWPGDTNINYSYGPDERGPAQLGNQVVRRGHLAALDRTTGKALSWDPGTDAFHGVVSLTAIPNGLLLGHDGNRIGGFSSVGRHGFFDFRKVPPAENPDSTIDEPFNGELISGGQTVTVLGRATATRGLQKVAIEVTNKQGQYLQANGSFSTVAANRNATLASPNAAASAWSIVLPAMPPNSYTIWSRSIDATAVKEPTRTAAFITVRPIDTVAPVWESLAPASGSVFSNSRVAMSGVLTDNEAVMSVGVSFYQRTTQQYLQSNGALGPNFYEFSMVLDAPDTARTTASLAVDLPDGSFYVTSTARDRSGVIARQYYSYVIGSGDFQPPTMTVTSPANGGVLDVNSILSGTASDDLGLDFVMFYVYRPYDDKGLTAEGGFGPVSYFRVPVTPAGATSFNWSVNLSVLPPGTYYGYAYAYDLVGRQTYAPFNFTKAVAGDAPPTVMIQTPTVNQQNFASLSYTFGGIATDDKGVSAVKVRVRQANPPYLHLQADGTWAAPIALVDANVASPGATSTAWSLPVTMKEPATYYAWAFPVDTAGQFPLYDGTTYSTYKVFPGDIDPVTVIDSPVQGVTVAGGVVTIAGSATDDKGVSAVRTYIYNTATGEGLRLDGTYGAGPNWVPVTLGTPGGTSTSFTLITPTLPPGNYLIYVSAEDSVGKWDVRYLTRTIIVTA